MKGFILLILTGSGLCGFSQQHMGFQSFPFARLSACDNRTPDAFASGLNQAAMAGQKSVSAGMAAERRFMMAEIQNILLLVNVPLKSLSVGFRGSRFGNAAFSETSVGLAFAKELSSQFSVGIQLSYFSRSAGSYGKASAIHGEAGVMLRLSETLNAGIHIYNPTGVRLGKSTERLASVFSLGLGYAPSEKLFLAADIQKVEDQPVNFHSGFHYYVVDRVRVSAGMTSAASSFYLGAGIRFKDLLITFSASHHPYLGWSPGIITSYSKFQ